MASLSDLLQRGVGRGQVHVSFACDVARAALNSTADDIAQWARLGAVGAAPANQACA